MHPFQVFRSFEYTCAPPFSRLCRLTLSAYLLFLGSDLLSSKCEQPLAVWSLIAGIFLVLLALVFLLDGVCGACSEGMLSYAGASEEDAVIAKKFDRRRNADEEPAASCWSMMTVFQALVMFSVIAIFIVGAYAVLEMFGRQRNASAGAEVCDRRLYDPLFFIILLVNLLVIITVSFLFCLAACDPSTCSCRGNRCCSCCTKPSTKEEGIQSNAGDEASSGSSSSEGSSVAVGAPAGGAAASASSNATAASPEASIAEAALPLQPASAETAAGITQRK